MTDRKLTDIRHAAHGISASEARCAGSLAFHRPLRLLRPFLTVHIPNLMPFSFPGFQPKSHRRKGEFDFHHCLGACVFCASQLELTELTDPLLSCAVVPMGS